MVTTITSELDKVAKDFILALSAFNQQEFNKLPGVGSWTPAQVAEHVRKSNKGMLNLLNGPVQETQRNPAALIPQLQPYLTDTTQKRKAPERVEPEDKEYNQEELLSKLNENFNLLKEAAQTLDLTPTCTAYSFPVCGELTRLEVFHFVLYHTQRHTEQVKKMLPVAAAS